MTIPSFLSFLKAVPSEEDNELMIVIHAIPHTHLDAGWFDTFENLHYNLVNPILDSLLIALE